MGPWCIGFYVLMVVCGNYVLLNLFVAILLSGNPNPSANSDPNRNRNRNRNRNPEPEP